MLMRVFLVLRPACRAFVGVSLLANYSVVAIVVMSVSVLMSVLVAMVVVMSVLVVMSVSVVRMIVKVIVFVSMGVMVLVGVVHRAAAGGVEHLELGPRDTPGGHLSRSELHPAYPEGGHMAPDHVQARPQIEEGAHEHIAAHPCRRVEVEDALHVSSPSAPGRPAC